MAFSFVARSWAKSEHHITPQRRLFHPSPPRGLLQGRLPWRGQCSHPSPEDKKELSKSVVQEDKEEVVERNVRKEEKYERMREVLMKR